MKTIMSKQEKIKYINEKYNADYKFSTSGRIYEMGMGKKIFTKFDDIVSHYEGRERERNAQENAKIVFLYIEKNGGIIIYKSIYGSRYYDYKGYRVRISNHSWTSEKHNEPDVNLYSNEKNGACEMIEKLKKL